MIFETAVNQLVKNNHNLFNIISERRQVKFENCVGLLKQFHDVGVSECWSWAHFFLQLIIIWAFLTMFIFNLKPGYYFKAAKAFRIGIS